MRRSVPSWASGLDGDDGTLHTDVLVGRGFRLHTEAASTGPCEPLSLTRGPGPHHVQVASGIVGIPDWHGERPASQLGNADDAHVDLGEESFALLFRHRE